jgi:quinol monooxygenase YgiN
MLVNAVMYTFPPEKADQVQALFAELAVKSREEPGCIAYEVARGAGGDSGTFMLFEKWRDQAALDEHYATEHFRKLGVNGVRHLATSRHAVKGDLIA